jgi:hypothetical protein
VRRVLPRIVVSLLITIGFIWAFKQGGLPFAPPGGATENLRWWGVPAFVALMLCATFLRTYRWFYLLRPIASDLSSWRVFGVGLVGYSAVFFAPLRLGEVVRPYLIAQDGQVSFVQAVGTVAAERIIDGLVLVLLTAAALWASTPLSPLPNHVGRLPIPVSLVPSTLWFASLMFASAFVLIACFYRWRRPARALVHRALKLVSLGLANFGAGVVDRLAESFGFLPSLRHLGPFLRDTLGYWTFGAAAQWVLLSAVGLEPSFAEAFVVLGVIGLGSLLPAGPGFFGAYQVAAYTALAMYFREREVLTSGALFVFLSYVTHVAMTALSSGVGFFVMSRVPARTALSPQ